MLFLIDHAFRYFEPFAQLKLFELNMNNDIRR
jgi:hypothetical protein